MGRLRMNVFVVLSIVVTCSAAWAQTPASPDTTATPALSSPPPPPAPSSGPDFPRGRISGYAFGDFYWNADGDPRHAYSAAGSDSGKASIDGSGRPITRDLNGFQFRRIYFQLDNDLSVRFATRFMLEADGKSLTSDSKIGVAVKNAYIQARNVYARGDVFFGLIATPTWASSEEFWGYRSIEKTIADFRGVASSVDLGVGLKGFVDGDHHLGYHLVLGNGQGQKAEDNRYKRAYLAVPIRFGDLRLEPYGDYEDGPRGTDRATYKLFAGFEPPRAAIGVELVDRVLHRPTGGNQEPAGGTVFARWAPSPAVAAFARFDLWRPDRRASNRVDSQLWIAGVDWQPFKDVHVMPNLEAQRYDAKGTAVAPAHDELQARVTVYYRYSKPQS